MIIKFGNITRLWKDHIADNTPLCVLFSICIFPDASIVQYQAKSVNDHFRRMLNANLLWQWGEVGEMLAKLSLISASHYVEWSLGTKRHFTTKSMYEYLEKDLAGCDYRWIWKPKIP